MQPIYLFADSQLLFWKPDNVRFLESIVRPVLTGSSTAAYIGASNGDMPEFYSVFEGAMEGIHVDACGMVHSAFGPEDRRLLSEADIIVLAGGDVETGWRIIEQTGMKDLVIERYRAGALLIGVSAGAVQLGRHGVATRPDSSLQLIDTMGLVPFIVSAHAEKDGWEQLTSVIHLLDGAAHGMGIPSGGGLLYHPDGSVEAIRHPTENISMQAGKLTRAVLFPGESALARE